MNVTSKLMKVRVIYGCYGANSAKPVLRMAGFYPFTCAYVGASTCICVYVCLCVRFQVGLYVFVPVCMIMSLVGVIPV